MTPVDDSRFDDEFEDRLDLEEARAAVAESKTETTIPWEVIKAELGL